VKNIQVIDGADNATYSIFQAAEDEFKTIFPLPGQDLEIVEDYVGRVGEAETNRTLSGLWTRPIYKHDVQGIHSTLYYDYKEKAKYLPKSRQEVECGAGQINDSERLLRVRLPKTYGASQRSAEPEAKSQRHNSLMTDLATHYLDEARRQFRGNKRLAEAAIAQLKDEDIFATLDPESNSVAILVKHLAGNMRSRFTDFLTSDGEKPTRFRDQEFELNTATTRADVMRWWDEGWMQVFTTLDALKPEDLMRTVTIRGEPHTALQAINRQIAHYSGHIGQIIFLAKHLRSSEWKMLSIPRGKSEEYKTAPPKSNQGLPRER
jgi:hypothetical protein